MTVSSAHLKIGMFQNSNILKMLPLRFLKHCTRSLTNMTVAETIAIFTYTFFFISFHLLRMSFIRLFKIERLTLGFRPAIINTKYHIIV